MTVEHPLCADPGCGTCAQRRATAAFRGQPLDEPTDPRVTCPECGHVFTPGGSVRVTESAPTGPLVEYADPQRRHRLDGEEHVRAAWAAVGQGVDQQVRARVKAALRRYDLPAPVDARSEAAINGKPSFDDIRELVRKALRGRARTALDGCYWVYVVDLSDTDVVYMGEDERLYQCTYTLSDTDVTLGEPMEVQRTYAPLAAGEQATEAGAARREQLLGRVVEAKGTDTAGGRVFRVRVIAHGDSRNGNRYPRSVLEAAAALYNGAKCYDHHRTEDEHSTSTIAGLVGHYRDAEATDDGIEADLHLFPSASHAADALDATLAAQKAGLPPVIGISHDIWGRFEPITEGSRRLSECKAITKVNSADLVAEPSARGQATRAVAGGPPDTDPTGTGPAGESTKESDVAPTKDEVLAALSEATDDDLARLGLSKATTPTKPTTESATPPADPPPVTKQTEAAVPKGGFYGQLMIGKKLEAASLPADMLADVTTALPEQITEAAVDAHIASIKAVLGNVERFAMVPTATVKVTQEAFGKKVKALDAMFDGNYREGYRSFRHAYVDFTGRRLRNFDEDENRVILRESITAFDSGSRRTESLDSASWGQVLGDSITRRMVRVYAQPNLQTWRQIVSDRVPVSDFRQQRRPRIGGFGTLPVVNQAQPYQPLTSPTDEEAVYAVIKRGGTEDLTLEMIANDDLGQIRQIPRLLGLAAAITLYRFVFDILVTNAATSYDSVALFHASHANTDNPALLSNTTLSTARRKMRQQATYGDSSNILSIVPKTLVVPSSLEEIAYQLVASTTAIPANTNDPADRPNLHRSMNEPIVVDYWTDQNDWFAAADGEQVPLIEVGFYQGREDPELFTQADPTNGSMFDADKQTYKVRHIYNATALDHRGFYRGANA
ncbi:MAG: Mu-like prophage major head subunit gpT family protein [Gammaproteobacteria bacterium]